VNQCDMWAYNFNEDENTFKDTCMNFPSTVESRRRKRILQDDVFPSTDRSLATSCIMSCADLRRKVAECDKNPRARPSCRISVCTQTITCPKRTRSVVYDPIDLSGKAIIFDCVLNCTTQKCEIDGGGNNQLFSGSYANVQFNNFNFTNAIGGAIQLTGGLDWRRSTLNLTNSSFVNNSASSGSALSANKTDIIVEGSTSSFVNNRGDRPPLELFSSTATIFDSYFEGNDLNEFGSGILTFDSKIELGMNVSFIKPDRSRRRNLAANDSKDCDVFVVMYDTNLKRNASCIQSGNQTIRPKPTACAPTVAKAPTPTPAKAPTSKPQPTSCFSGVNTVDVKGVGNIRIDQLQIGDYVRSSSGEFTQVYGFGHLDRNLEASFLQIFLDDVKNNATDVIPTTPLEVSAQHLLLLDSTLRHPIRASDVAVGDWLNGKQINKIDRVIRRGVYAPLTHSGDLIVSGVCGSNYVAVFDVDWIWDQHRLGHLLYLPQRVYCRYNIEVCKKESYISGYGYPAYIAVHGGYVFNRLNAYYTNTNSNGNCWIAGVMVGILVWYFNSHLRAR
jgi:Hint module